MFSLADLHNDNTFDSDSKYYIKTHRTFNFVDKNDVITQIKNHTKFIDNWDNIIVAGGSLSDLIEKGHRIKDYDIFFYGITAEEALNKVKHFYNNFNGKADVCVSKNAITFNKIFQFVLKLYSTKEEIINSFDIDASCIGFDGESVFMNKRCKKALKTGYINVNIDRYTSNFTHRINNYYMKGFGIIFHNLKLGDKKQFKMGGNCIVSFDTIDTNNVLIKRNNNYFRMIYEKMENDFYDSDIEYYNNKTLLLNNYLKDKHSPFAPNKIAQTYTFGFDIMRHYRHTLHKNVFTTTIDINKLHKYFGDEYKNIMLGIATNDDKALNKIIDETILKNKHKLDRTFELQWDNYLDGFNADEFYNSKMTPEKFYSYDF